jgi:hypothetical protein
MGKSAIAVAWLVLMGIGLAGAAHLAPQVQAASVGPTLAPCSVLMRERTRGVLDFTVEEAWVLGYVMGWESYSDALPPGTALQADIWQILDWIADYCHTNPDNTVQGATSAVMYERVIYPILSHGN